MKITDDQMNKIFKFIQRLLVIIWFLGTIALIIFCVYISTKFGIFIANKFFEFIK